MIKVDFIKKKNKNILVFFILICFSNIVYSQCLLRFGSGVDSRDNVLYLCNESNYQEIEWFTKTSDITGIDIGSPIPGMTLKIVGNRILLSGSPSLLFNGNTSNKFRSFTGTIKGLGCSNSNTLGYQIVVRNGIRAQPPQLSGRNLTICQNTNYTDFIVQSSRLFLVARHLNIHDGVRSFSGLPSGIRAVSRGGDTVWFEGITSQTGTFNYTIQLISLGNCPEDVTFSGVLTVMPKVTVTVSEQTSTPIVCSNLEIVPITHITTGASGIGSPTGLPNGLTANWESNKITISGTPTETGTFKYIIPVTGVGSCANSVSAEGTIEIKNGISSTVSTPSESPTLCMNSVLNDITHTTTGVTGIGIATGLPNGVIANWASNVITISGTPTESGLFNYTIPLLGGECETPEAKGTITVNQNTFVSDASSTESVCLNTKLTDITHNTTGVTGITEVVGLPSGVIATWNSSVITISGTPTELGSFNYRIRLQGECSKEEATGLIMVTSNSTVSTPSSIPVSCVNKKLIDIKHTTTGVTGINQTIGLPSGVTAVWDSNEVIISGTPTESGVFDYKISLISGCNQVDAIGAITVNKKGSVSIASSNPILCIGSMLTNLTHTTNGFTGIGTAVGLPNGIAAKWESNMITISGVPTENGVFNYEIPLIGGCGANVSAKGTITVGATVDPTSSSNINFCANSVIPDITHTTTGATGIGAPIGLPNGVTAVWNSNTITIGGTPTENGVFNYEIPVIGSCTVNVSAKGTIVVGTTVGPASLDNLNTCINTIIPDITHITTGATGIDTPLGLPNGITAVWNLNTITISGTPIENGVFNYEIPLKGNCGLNVSAKGTINVNNGINTPVIGKIDQTSCSSNIGAVTLSGLPSGNWTIEQSGNAKKEYNGSGTEFLIGNLSAGTYNFLVRMGNCVSSNTVTVQINNVICATNDDYTSMSLNLGEETESILINDTLNGNAVNSSNVVLTAKVLPKGFVLEELTGKIKLNQKVLSNIYTFEYEICEVGVPGNCDTATVRIKVEDSCNEFFNLITPDGDGENDVFFIPCIENFPNNKVKIFNRSGILVYKANGYNNKTIVFNGKSTESGVFNKFEGLPFGTYYYEIDYGNGTNKTGWIFLNN